MNRDTQLLFSGLLVPPLVYILTSDYLFAANTALVVFFAFLIWKYQEKIRSNSKLMYILNKIF